MEIQLERSAQAAGRAAHRTGVDGSRPARIWFAAGYDPNYGARPLKRAIQREIETPMARRILGGEVRDGQRVVVDLDPVGQLEF